MFGKESDFEAFERVMVEAHLRQPVRIMAWRILPESFISGAGRSSANCGGGAACGRGRAALMRSSISRDNQTLLPANDTALDGSRRPSAGLRRVSSVPSSGLVGFLQ